MNSKRTLLRVFLAAIGLLATIVVPAFVLIAGQARDRKRRPLVGELVRLHGKPLTLTATEFRLLEFLMSRPGVVFSREQLLDYVWGMDRAVTDRTVDVHILRLRQKVEADPASPALIRSVRGFGYLFDPGMETAPARV